MHGTAISNSTCSNPSTTSPQNRLRSWIAAPSTFCSLSRLPPLSGRASPRPTGLPGSSSSSLGAAGILVLYLIRNRFRFSNLVYVVAAIHYVVLSIGAKYTYADVPLFDWLQQALDLSRNHFDRVGHFMQGVTPALVMREVLFRRTGIGKGVWLALCSVSVAMAFSALYEILEWLWVVWFYPDAGPEWLGMQGDPFDAQADMLMATLGGLLSGRARALARPLDGQAALNSAWGDPMNIELPPDLSKPSWSPKSRLDVTPRPTTCCATHWGCSRNEITSSGTSARSFSERSKRASNQLGEASCMTEKKRPLSSKQC
ncbi:MAG: DUF2238 domain-containing protein [Bryobacterales bacterium]